ncbi:hypothetical protein IJT17_03615, partial [bacterium]|nr:hypothetical protein [bacterium]
MVKAYLKELSLALCCFLLVLSAVFYPAFWQGHVVYGEDGFGSDCFDLNIPRHCLAVASVRDFGELPFWASSFGSGTQLIEEGETAVFYPFSLLPYFVLPIPSATNTVIFSALLIAMSGMYAWLRGNGAAPLPAFLGALAWGCGGCFAFRLKHFNIIHVLAWLPFSMLFLQLYWERCRLRYLL